MRLGYSSAAPYRNEIKTGEYGLDNIKIKGFRKKDNKQGRNNTINVQRLDDPKEPYAEEDD